jgi:hypothetical protein
MGLPIHMYPFKEQSLLYCITYTNLNITYTFSHVTCLFHMILRINKGSFFEGRILLTTGNNIIQSNPVITTSFYVTPLVYR